MVDLIRETIVTHWSPGIVKEGDQARALEFRLKNYAWTAISSARLLRQIMEALFNHRWVITTVTAVSRSPFVLDQMFFEYVHPQPRPRHWTMIQFVGVDKLWVYDAPGDLLHVMVAALGGNMITHGPAKKNAPPGTYEFKLKGAPWSGRPKDHTAASLHVMTLLQTLRRNGFEIYANIDAMLQFRKEHAQRWQDTWILNRPVDYDPATSPDFQ